jgi:TadE-like protein
VTIRSHEEPRGQALVEFALVAPLLFLVLGGIVTLGIGVFYQQQLANAAREAARYAAIHSESSQCPTISNRPPYPSMLPPEVPDYDCDPPWLRWPEMTGHARSRIWGMSASDVKFSACWSGYWDNETNGYDAGPTSAGIANQFKWCRIGGVDPRANSADIPCPPPLTTLADDEASSLAHSGASTANQVTIYACYVWTPPFIGELVGGSVTMRAVATEAMQHQQ